MAAVASPVKKAAAPKTKVSKKPAALHPRYLDMILKVLGGMKGSARQGTSRQTIVREVMRLYPQVGKDERSVNTRVKLALRMGLAKSWLIHTKGVGVSGRFKINRQKMKAQDQKAKAKVRDQAKKAKARDAAKAKKAKKASKPKKKTTSKPKAKTTKKPAAKKTTSAAAAKKPATKKPKKPAAAAKPKKAAASPKKKVAKKPAVKKPAAKKSPKKSPKKTAAK